MDLWVQQIEGGDPVQLTRDLGFCQDPAFSPDGSRIVLRCGTEPDSIYVVPTFGGLPKKLAEGEWPQFSPDGSQIAYMASASGAAGARSHLDLPAGGGTAKEIKIDKGITAGRCGARTARACSSSASATRRMGETTTTGSSFRPMAAPSTPTGAVRRLRGGRNRARARSQLSRRMVCLFTDGNLRQHQHLSNAVRCDVPNGLRRSCSGDCRRVVSTSRRRRHRTAAGLPSRSATTCRRTSGGLRSTRTRARSRASLSASPAAWIPAWAPSPSRDGTRLAYLGGSSESAGGSHSRPRNRKRSASGRSEGVEQRGSVAGWFDGRVQLRPARQQRNLFGASGRRCAEEDLRRLRPARGVVTGSHEAPL